MFNIGFIAFDKTSTLKFFDNEYSIIFKISLFIKGSPPVKPISLVPRFLLIASSINNLTSLKVK